MNIWKESFTVRASEVGADTRATMPSIFNYLQETASNHAFALQVSLEQLQESRIFWVLARMRVFVDRFPAWRDVIHVETWPSGDDGLYAGREFIITDARGEVIIRATSSWVLLDMTTHRPVRIPAAVSELRVPDRTIPVTEPAPRLYAPTEAQGELTVSARWSDIDINNHVNNVRYVAWALDAVPDHLTQGREIAHVDVVYRAEMFLGDVLHARVGKSDKPGEADYLEHQIVRESDGREAVLIRSLLRPTRRS